MFSMLTYCGDAEELKLLDRASFNEASSASDDEWSFSSFSEFQQFVKYLEENDLTDIACIDVTHGATIPLAERIRGDNADALILIIADVNIPPNSYLRPTVMAASLLLRPLDERQICAAIGELMRILCARDSETSEKQFFIKTRDGNVKVSYKNVIYFESRDKKIYMRTEREEVSFYSTIEKLEEMLPDTFFRCHRSYMINTEKIEKIVLADNAVYLDGGIFVPISRSCRNAIKEYMQ